MLRKRDDDARAAERAALTFRADLATELLRASLLPKDQDPDYLHFKIARDPELLALQGEGKLADLIGKLKERGLVVVPGTVAPRPEAPPSPPSPDLKAAPDPAFASIKEWKDVLNMPYARQQEFEKKHPDAYRALRTAWERSLSAPQARR